MESSSRVVRPSSGAGYGGSCRPHYRHALELNPNYADAYTNLGSALVAQGKFAEAAEMAEKAAALGPRSADAHACLASALMNLGHTDEAILQNRKALEFNPNLVSA